MISIASTSRLDEMACTTSSKFDEGSLVGRGAERARETAVGGTVNRSVRTRRDGSWRVGCRCRPQSPSIAEGKFGRPSTADALRRTAGETAVIERL